MIDNEKDVVKSSPVIWRAFRDYESVLSDDFANAYPELASKIQDAKGAFQTGRTMTDGPYIYWYRIVYAKDGRILTFVNRKQKADRKQDFKNETLTCLHAIVKNTTLQTELLKRIDEKLAPVRDHYERG
ncbi:hypothetical protein NTE_01169 [Candidatus Nitrososphaera evergladensis SR1]|uniref:Uncharacterized protein n=1 Tax=Candidatus Nitrososphaera evergladensis SR1 TaxID=1459636 RepID=A0A075MR02_9ARCH|nr:hypothetical protein [Candidatus Nitrososphaera evergladensis]AIF83242.1 hypothetical protein NTE_01169 [Candidatus Nitrososphaera evergladensis SR1]